MKLWPLYVVIGLLIFGLFINVKKQGSVILLNGVSSSGKSVIIQELFVLNPKLKILKVDDWFPEDLKKTVEGYGWQEDSGIDPWVYLHEYAFNTTGKYYFNAEIREKFFNNSSEFYQQAQDLVAMGYDVIIDTVLEFERDYKEFDLFFNNINIKKVLIYCPLDVLFDRVEKRNKSGVAQEQRTVFQSFEQFVAMFKVQESLTEEVVDRVQTCTIKQALDDAIQQLIDSNTPEPYLVKLQEFKKTFIKKFKLDEQNSIALSAQHSYDLILNSSESTPRELAEKIISIF